ncbi:MAG TPA: Stk1 family PASTA domain-containing Ser/Thr kinase, partial [Kineosporiaceae bacterium]|nr:Stk1 family PASTA domain-containing Ser/Thr kinase [Kineosporiaceae bacterium]
MNDNPRVLGNRYEVGELLGRGGMAEVHLGRDARLGRAVAIKLLRTDLARDSTFQARFRREAQSAAALNHPAIVAVYDTGEEQVVEAGGGVFNLPYIVMEHIEGRTLRDVLAEGHHLDIDAALDIITGVLTALEYSHRIGIVHRDIKPANVMLTPVGDVKVMDFGIARAMSDSSSTMTQTQAVIGTAQYLSPEQARGEQVDTRSDLYSAGCLLYELLTGRPPFTADSPVAVAYQHVREPPIPPSQVIGGIPDSVDRIVLHSLAKGRDERYQSAADFRADVEAARGGRQVSAAIPVMHGSNATTQYMPMQDPNSTRVVPGGAMGAGALLGDPSMGQGQQYADPYNQGDQYNPNDPYNQGDQYNQGDYGRRQQREEEKPASNRNVILAGIAFLVVVALISFLFWNNIIKNNNDNGDAAGTTVSVPDVIGKTKELATKSLNDAGFKDVAFETKVSKQDELNKVILQNPEAEAKAKTSQQVVITIGLGPDTVEMPDLKGKTRAEAIAELTEQKLELGDVTLKDDPSVPRNTVISTDPSAGDDVKPNSSVNLVISSGKMEVPDVTGKTKAQARSEL